MGAPSVRQAGWLAQGAAGLPAKCWALPPHAVMWTGAMQLKPRHPLPCSASWSCSAGPAGCVYRTCRISHVNAQLGPRDGPPADGKERGKPVAAAPNAQQAALVARLQQQLSALLQWGGMAVSRHAVSSGRGQIVPVPAGALAASRVGGFAPSCPPPHRRRHRHRPHLSSRSHGRQLIEARADAARLREAGLRLRRGLVPRHHEGVVTPTNSQLWCQKA